MSNTDWDHGRSFDIPHQTGRPANAAGLVPISRIIADFWDPKQYNGSINQFTFDPCSTGIRIVTD